MAEHVFAAQRVFHDGTSMIVVQPGGSAEVPDALYEGLRLGGAFGPVKEADAEAPDSAPAPEPRQPQIGDVVTHEEGKAGWHTITAPWLDEPVKLRGDDAARAKVAELEAMVPQADDAQADAPPA